MSGEPVVENHGRRGRVDHFASACPSDAHGNHRLFGIRSAETLVPGLDGLPDSRFQEADKRQDLLRLRADLALGAERYAHDDLVDFITFGEVTDGVGCLLVRPACNHAEWTNGQAERVADCHANSTIADIESEHCHGWPVALVVGAALVSTTT